MEENEQTLDFVSVTPPPTPPRTPAASADAPGRSTWPAMLGTIAIVLGALGVLMGVISVVSTFYLDALLSSVPSAPAANPQALSQLQAIRDASGEWAGVLLGMQFQWAAVPVVLLAGGILLVRRRHASSITLRAWAVLQAIAIPVRVVGGYLIFQQATVGLPGLAVVMTVTVVVGLMLGWAFPAFMLIWFGRRRIREDVEAWN